MAFYWPYIRFEFLAITSRVNHRLELFIEMERKQAGKKPVSGDKKSAREITKGRKERTQSHLCSNVKGRLALEAGCIEWEWEA